MAISTALSVAIIKGSADLGTALINAHAKRSSDPSDQKIKNLKTNITPHIDATFLKCKTIKTLLNPQSPAEFLSVYATQRFDTPQGNIDHYGMVEFVKGDTNNIIVTGTGGSGKSMFTKYLWLSLFVDGDGKIPLFIELRNINNISTDDIVSYIRHTISNGPASLNEKDYRSYLGKGDFVIILDGFDEINEEKQQTIQTQVLELVANYPTLKVIITSRPDGRFSSWPSFQVVSVAPLTKADVIELVENAEFAEDSKQLFLKKLKTAEFYDRHSGFLSNPLLASMMLLTFSHNFDIPDRMHLFYEQAFDALYQRHDSYKPGGYKREFRTKFSEDVLKRIVSYFCLITYSKEVFGFTRDEALNFLSDAARLSGVEADSADLLQDLVSCVCFLILDGMQYIFSHRSFQEYFAAYCLARVSQSKFDILLTRFSRRQNDQVLMLISDMNPEVLRKLYILPNAEKFKGELQRGIKKPSPSQYLSSEDLSFYIQRLNVRRMNKNKNEVEEEVDLVHLLNVKGDSGNEFYNFANTVVRLAKTPIPSQKVRDDRKKRDRLAIDLMLHTLKIGNNDCLIIASKDGNFVFGSMSRNNIVDRLGDHLTDAQSNVELEQGFKSSYMYEFIGERMKVINEYIDNALRMDSDVSSAMDDLLAEL